MDLREARRAAEKAAREKISDRVRLAGELGVLAQRQAEMTAALALARERAAAIVVAAQDSAQRILDVAAGNLDEASAQYGSAYAAALTAGWSESDLNGIGFADHGLNAGDVKEPTTGS
jgi:hypothetical protein